MRKGKAGGSSVMSSTASTALRFFMGMLSPRPRAGRSGGVICPSPSPLRDLTPRAEFPKPLPPRRSHPVAPRYAPRDVRDDRLRLRRVALPRGRARVAAADHPRARLARPPPGASAASSPTVALAPRWPRTPQLCSTTALARPHPRSSAPTRARCSHMTTTAARSASRTWEGTGRCPTSDR